MSTILIIDDDARFRTQACDVLAADGFVVIGEAADGASGLKAAQSLRPDFVLLDIGLPDAEGFEVARALALSRPPPLVVLTSSRDARAYGRRLSNGLFLGFIPKERISGAAIRALVDGG
jgi:DNA-binding NarL/FixJ family response regulator